MSDGNHSAPATTQTASRRKLWLFFGGTVILILVGGLLIQFLKGEATSAQQEPAEQSQSDQDQPGVSRARGQHNIQARVHGSNSTYEITYQQLADECVERYGTEVLASMIDRQIIELACRERGITVDDKDIDFEISKIARRYNLTDQNWLAILQNDRKITANQYRYNVIWPMLALKKLAGKEVELSEEDIKKGYIRDYGERVKARMIVLDNPGRAEEVWNLADQDKTRESFGKLARKYSIEPNSKALDGAIPPIPRYSGNDNLEREAFRLKESEISGIIQLATNRYAILLCEGRTERKVELSEVRDDLINNLREEKTQESVAKVFDSLKKKARVENIRTGEVINPERDVRSAGTVPGDSRAGVRPAGGSDEDGSARPARR